MDESLDAVITSQKAEGTTPDEAPVSEPTASEELAADEPTASEELAADEPTASEVGDADEDYAAIVEHDLEVLRESFPELSGATSIYELKNPIRYGALRDLGLTPEEAYLASGGRGATYDNRTHLTPSVPRGTARGASIPRAELAAARELFSDMSEADIIKLYRRVTQ